MTTGAEVHAPSPAVAKPSQLPAVAKPSQLPAVGVNFHGIWADYTNAQRDAVLDKLAAAGVKWVRTDIGWSWFSPIAKGTVDQEMLDRANYVVDAARARGIKVLFMVSSTPEWANSKFPDGATTLNSATLTSATAEFHSQDVGKGISGAGIPTGTTILSVQSGTSITMSANATATASGVSFTIASRGYNVPPTRASDFGDFMGYMAGQFAGRVAAWQVWNEPNIDVFWSTTDPVKYASLVRAAYPSIKKADPSTTVVVGAVNRNDDPWLARMYDAGISGSYDVLAAHPYQNPPTRGPEFPDDGNVWVLDHIRAVRKLMVDRGEEAKGLWATEFGWSSYDVSEETQADFLKRSLHFFADQHPYVSNVFWYNARSTATGNPGEDAYGLLRRDLTEKPAYKALKTTLRSTR